MVLNSISGQVLNENAVRIVIKLLNYILTNNMSLETLLEAAEFLEWNKSSGKKSSRG